MCLPMMLWAQGQLTAYYAKVDIENYVKGQLIVDTNDPINRMVDFNKSLFRYEGDAGDEQGYYILFDKSQITVKEYQMSPLPVKLVRGGASFQSRDGFEIRIFPANANGHGFYGLDEDKLSNHLAVLGYSLDASNDSRSKYTIFKTRKGAAERSKDVVLLEKKIQSDFPSLYYIYDEALSTFGNAEYKSCIDNCRTLYEKITQALTGDGSDKAALTLSQESVTDDTGARITSKEKIYKYWLDKKKGANRYRYFTTLYSVMSGLGTHGEEEPSKADAVLILRALEDVLVWILKI